MTDTPPVKGAGHVQWKGTDVCLDFTCLCDTSLHFDGTFAYAIRCWHCDRTWELASCIPLTLVDENDCNVIQDTHPVPGLDTPGTRPFTPYNPN